MCLILLYLLLWLKAHLNLDFLGKSSATLNSFLMIVMKLMWQFIDPCRGMMRADFLKLFQSICPEADGECFPTDTLSNCWQHRQRCTGEAENIFTKQPTFPTGLSYYVIRCGCSIARNTVANNPLFFFFFSKFEWCVNISHILVTVKHFPDHMTQSFEHNIYSLTLLPLCL